jgi:hypothetical protein
MTEGQEGVDRTNLPAEGEKTKTLLAQTSMAVFFIHSVSDTISQCYSFPKCLADRRGPQFDKYCSMGWKCVNIRNNHRYTYTGKRDTEIMNATFHQT